MKNWFEFKYALRTLVKSPGHSALSILIVTLSLSVGIISLSLVDNVLLSQQEIENGDRWYFLGGGPVDYDLPFPIDLIDVGHYQFIADHQTVFETFGGIKAKSQARVSDGETSYRLSTAEVSPELLTAAGFKPLMGRTFQVSDTSNSTVVIISESFWKNFFASRPDIIGSPIQVNEQSYTVVGVMPKSTVLGAEYDVWLAQDWLDIHNNEEAYYSSLSPVGILKPGLTQAKAQQQLSQLTANYLQASPDAYGGEAWKSELIPFDQFLTRFSVPMLIASGLVSILVMLLGSINVANLFIARNIERQQEFAVRKSLGCSNFRLLQQVLTESFFICLFGFVFALPLMWLAMQGLNLYLQNLGEQFFLNFGASLNTPSNWLLTLDFRFLGIASLLLTFIWLICAVWPSLKLRKLDTDRLVLNSGKGATRQSSFRPSRLIIGVQIATACFLLVISGSLYFSVKSVLNTDYGFRIDNRYIAGIELTSAYQSYEQKRDFIEAVEANLRGNNSIAEAAVISGIPYAAGLGTYAIPDNSEKNTAPFPVSMSSMFSPEAFSVMGIDIIEGRQYNSEDVEQRRPVIIVDEIFAEENWPGESAIGKNIRLYPERGGYLVEVVGVARKSVFMVDPTRGLQSGTMFMHRRFLGGQFFELVFASPLKLNNADILETVRNAVIKADPNVAVFGPRTMQAHLESPFILHRMVANLFAAIGLSTVLLAALGVFALTSRAVRQQTHFIGIRRALGSSNWKVYLYYLKQSAVYLLVGVFLGGGFAILASNELSSLFANLLSFLPLVLVTATLCLTSLVLAGILIPTSQVLKSEPGDALHQI